MKCQVRLRGVKRTPKSSGKTANSEMGGTGGGDICPDLTRIINAWPTVSDDQNRKILTIIEDG